MLSGTATAIDPAALGLVDARWLPPTIKRLVAVLGLESTVRLLQARGGTDLALPLGEHRSCRADAALRSILEAPQIEALYAEFGDGRKEMTLPKVDKIVMQLRNHAIRRLHRQDGLSMARIALRFGLTERQVWNILHAGDGRRPQPEARQASLFD